MNETASQLIEETCVNFSIDHISESAQQLYEEFFNKGLFVATDENIHDWIVCAVYISMIENRFSYGCLDSQLMTFDNMPCSVADLLLFNNCRVKDFLVKMELVKLNLQLIDAVCQHLRVIQRKFLISCNLYRKLCQLIKDIFLKDEKEILLAQQKHQLCWLYFINIKDNSHNLVDAYHVLLCCLAHVIQNSDFIPTGFPSDLFNDLSTGINIYKYLCIKYNAATFDNDMLNRWCSFDQELLNVVHLNVSELIEKYSTEYRKIGDINEVDYLEEEYYLSVDNVKQSPKVPSNLTHNSVQASNVKITPISTAMQKISQFSRAFNANSDHPTPNLIRHFLQCTANPQLQIEGRLTRMSRSFTMSYVGEVGRSNVARSRFELAQNVYYDVMEALLTSETERLFPLCDFSSLLSQETFHVSLMACSLEVVLFVHNDFGSSDTSMYPLSAINGKRNTPSFPWILNVLSLNSFDFFKVIDNFVKVKPNMPNDIANHLVDIENTILSHIAWKSDSSLYNSLPLLEASNYKGTRFRIIGGNRITIFQPPSTTSGLNASNLDQVKVSKSAITFINKAVKLCFSRAKCLFELLKIPDHLLQRVTACFEYCISVKYKLFQDRHIDQILMCTVFSVTKILEYNLLFKDIIRAYKNILPSYFPDLIKNVPIANGEKCSIITFYNKIFIGEVKDYLYDQSNYEKTLPCFTPPINSEANNKNNNNNNNDNNDSNNNYTSSLSPTHSVTKRLSGVKVDFSPLKSPFKVPLTPVSKTLYCFTDSPISPLKLVVKRRGINAQSHASKHLKFDSFELSENKPVDENQITKGPGK